MHIRCPRVRRLHAAYKDRAAQAKAVAQAARHSLELLWRGVGVDALPIKEEANRGSIHALLVAIGVEHLRRKGRGVCDHRWYELSCPRRQREKNEGARTQCDKPKCGCRECGADVDEMDVGRKYGKTSALTGKQACG